MVAELQMTRAVDSGALIQLFRGAATFPTRAEAVAACVRLGRGILDQKVPDHPVPF